MCLVIVIGVGNGDTGILNALGVSCQDEVHAGETAAKIRECGIIFHHPGLNGKYIEIGNIIPRVDSQCLLEIP